mmetsp:Transcript_56784/g.182435  ORF Transcript_56784/g.182435 Transcript_56784/m.182435 type:complete len:337 (+) Transcript_56784:181-1191(+)
MTGCAKTQHCQKMCIHACTRPPPRGSACPTSGRCMPCRKCSSDLLKGERECSRGSVQRPRSQTRTEANSLCPARRAASGRHRASSPELPPQLHEGLAQVVAAGRDAPSCAHARPGVRVHVHDQPVACVQQLLPQGRVLLELRSKDRPQQLAPDALPVWALLIRPLHEREGLRSVHRLRLLDLGGKLRRTAGKLEAVPSMLTSSVANGVQLHRCRKEVREAVGRGVVEGEYFRRVREIQRALWHGVPLFVHNLNLAAIERKVVVMLHALVHAMVLEGLVVFKQGAAATTLDLLHPPLGRFAGSLLQVLPGNGESCSLQFRTAPHRLNLGLSAGAAIG